MEEIYQKKKTFIVNVIYGILIMAIIYISLKYVLHLISPFIFAFIIAFILKGPTKLISKITFLPRKLVALILVLLFYSTIGLLISLLGIKIISTITQLTSVMPVFYESQLEPFLMKTFDRIEVTIVSLDPALVDVLNEGFNQFVNTLGESVTKISVAVVSGVSSLASSLPAFFIRMLLMIISTFFIAMDYEKLMGFVFRQFNEKTSGIMLQIKNYVIGTLFVVVRSYGLIMSITFIELSIGLSIINIPNAIAIAGIIAIFDILPVLGTGGIMIPWIAFSFIQGDLTLGLSLLAVYGFVTVMRNILEPKIVGSQLGLHPVLTLMSMFVGANLFGVLGLFGFPISLSLLKHFNDTKSISLFK